MSIDLRDLKCLICGCRRGEHRAEFLHCPLADGKYGEYGTTRFKAKIGDLADKVDMVNAPPHYTSHPDGYEALDVLRKGEYYNLTTAMKYLWRINFGSKTNPVEDAKKAIFYIQDWIDHQGKELG